MAIKKLKEKETLCVPTSLPCCLYGSLHPWPLPNLLSSRLTLQHPTEKLPCPPPVHIGAGFVPAPRATTFLTDPLHPSLDSMPLPAPCADALLQLIEQVCLCSAPSLARTAPLTFPGASCRMRSCLQGKVAQAGGRYRTWRRGTGYSALGGRVEVRGR